MRKGYHFIGLLEEGEGMKMRTIKARREWYDTNMPIPHNYCRLPAQTLADSSGEIVLNVKPQRESSPATTRVSRTETGSLSFAAESSLAAVSSGALAATSGIQYGEVFNNAASGYNEYCEIIDVSDSEVEDCDMQEAILQSSTSDSNEDR